MSEDDERIMFVPDQSANLVFRIEEIPAPWVKRQLFTAIFFVAAFAGGDSTFWAQAGSKFRIVSIDSGCVLKRYKEKFIWYGKASVGQLLRQDLSELSAGEFAERWIHASKRSSPSPMSAELLERFVRRFRVPAVAAALVRAYGPTEVQMAGTRWRGGGGAVLIPDQWHIGSCTKTFTAVLWACLVERGEAEWDMPITAVFADFGDVHPGWDGLTIDDALQCRAGFAANMSPALMQQAWFDIRPLIEQRADAARQALQTPPRRPGRYAYSNLGYIVVGAAIDRLAGTAYEQALHDRVFPLGIQSAGFGAPAEIWGHPARLRLGVADWFRGQSVDPVEPRSDNPAVYASAGMLHLTIEDWAAFCRIFLTEGGDLLAPETIERLLDSPPGRGAAMAMGWAKPVYIRGASHAMQGSNTMWTSTALLARNREGCALVVCNDGRTRLLNKTARLATRVLDKITSGT